MRKTFLHILILAATFLIPGFAGAQCLNGTYTVGGTGADFPNLVSAATALNTRGVCGPVIFQVNPGTYPGRVTVADVSGVSAANTVLFAGSGSTSCFIEDSVADALVSFARTGYVTFRGFTVTNKSTASCTGIAVAGNVQASPVRNITIARCVVSLPNSGLNTSHGILVSHATNAASSLSYLDSVTVDSNTVTGGTNGITIYAGFNATSAFHRGHQVRNNTIINSYYNGIYIYAVSNPFDVLNNTVTMNPAFTGNSNGIANWNCRNRSLSRSVAIKGNRIKASGAGIQIFSDSSTASAPHLIYNNTVSGNMMNGANYGIYITTTNGGHYDVLHNTVHITVFGTTAYGFHYSNTNAGSSLRAKNNIFSIMPESGGTVLPANITQKQTGNVINCNVYHNAYSSAIISRGGTLYTITDFQTDSTGGDSSFNRMPSLSSDMRATDGCSRGTDLRAFVPADIAGAVRTATPVIGAYEFTAQANDLIVEQLYSPVPPLSLNAQDLVLRVRNAGSNVVNNYEVSYTVNGSFPVHQNILTPIEPCDTALIIFTGGQQISLTTGLNELNVYTHNPNGTTDGNLLNDTIRVVYQYEHPLNGNYTIGGTPGPMNFASVTEAAEVLNRSGISGPVHFTVHPGTYTGQVILNKGIYGISATNRITFEGIDAATTRITSASPAAQTIRMNQASFVAFRNLTIENTAAGTCYGIVKTGNIVNNTGIGFHVSNCRISLPNAGTSTSFGILVTGDLNGVAETAQNIDSICIDSNTITGAAVSISITGNSTAAYNKGILVRWNTLNAYTGGMRLMGIYNAMEVSDNIVNSSTANTASYGMWIENNRVTGSLSTILSNNRITASYRGIYCNNYNSTASNPARIFNNMITCTGSLPGQTYGLYLSTSTATTGIVEVYHNTVNMTGASATYALYYTGAASGSGFYNNIFSVAGAGTYPAYFGTNVTSNTIDYNLYYNAAAGNLVYRGSAFTVFTYRSTTAGGEHSYHSRPAFISATDLRFLHACLTGTNLSAAVPSDLFGTPRATAPVIGAHETTGTANDASIDLVQVETPYTTAARDLRIRIRNNSTSVLISADLSYRLNNDPVKTISYPGLVLGGCDTVSFLFTGAERLQLQPGKNTLVVYVSSPNGTTDEFTGNDTLVVNLSTITPRAGSAFAGQGFGRYARLQNMRLEALPNFSAEAWVKVTNPATQQRIAAKSNSQDGFDLGIQAGSVWAGVWTNAGTRASVLGGSIQANRWTHVAITWESGTGLKAYVNGTQVAFTASAAATLAGSLTDLTIGANSWDFNNQVNGQIDEVRLWNLTLDSTGIRRNMHRTLTGQEPGLISYVQLNEGTGNTWVSDAASGAYGTITGTGALVNSSIPAGGDSTMVQQNISAGMFNTGNITINITDAFDNASDLAITEIPFAPNALPVAAHQYTEKYWIVRAFNTPGVYSADLQFALPAGYLNTSDAALGLYRREYNSDSAYWTFVKYATTINAGSVLFTGIDTFGQFTIASNGSSPLPVALSGFTGLRSGSDAQLTWTTASESNNKGFYVERSADGSQFRQIGFVKGAGHSAIARQYAFTDKEAFEGSAGSWYYRLAQADQNGRISRSASIRIGNEAFAADRVQVSPNPFSSEATVIIEVTEAGETTIALCDMTGKSRLVQGTLTGTGIQHIKLENTGLLAPGLYFITVTSGGRSHTMKLLKQ